MKLLKKLLTPTVILFFLAFLVRVGVLVYQFKFSGDFQASPYLPTSDRRDYDSIAINLIQGYGYKSPDMLATYRPPFYPFLLA